METTVEKDLGLGTKWHAITCIALLVTAVGMLVGGALSVRSQNALQAEQAQQQAQRQHDVARAGS